MTVIPWILEFCGHISVVLGISPGKQENDYPLSIQWHKVSAIQTPEDHWGCRGSTWSEDQSEVTVHDITVSPTSLVRYSNEKQILHKIAVSPNSWELSKD
jgi:hypothetical protein